VTGIGAATGDSSHEQIEGLECFGQDEATSAPLQGKNCEQHRAIGRPTADYWAVCFLRISACSIHVLGHTKLEYDLTSL
jgi:hypothetical protein